jgi:DnaD/phage-associated family protein
MARPQKEGMDYFPHDCDARNDMKLRKLRAVYGNDGYSTYFILLENIYRNKDYSIDISDVETRLILCEECKLSEENFLKIIEKCLDLNLFDKSQYEKFGILTAEAIRKRTEPIENKRVRDKQRYQENKNISEVKTPVETPQSKVKKSKVNIEEEEEKKQIGEIFKFFSNNISPITPFQSEIIIQYLDEDKLEPEMIMAVMEDSVGKDNPWSWIKKVLANSGKDNIKTLEMYEAKKIEKERKKGDKSGGKAQSNKPTFNNFEGRGYDPKLLSKWVLMKNRDDISQEEKERVYNELVNSCKGK